MPGHLAGLVLQHVPKCCDIFVDRLAPLGWVNGRSFSRQREMALRECLQIEAGIILVRAIVIQDRIGGLVVLQIGESFAVVEYPLHLHLAKQIAQLHGWWCLRSTWLSA